MRVLNPHWEDPYQAQLDAYRQHFIDYLATIPTDQQWITFDAIRSHFSKTAEQFPDGFIHQVLNDLGHQVEAE